MSTLGPSSRTLLACRALLGFLCTLSVMSQAEETPSFWGEVRESANLSVSAGARYEDNLVVEELDSVSRESGSAWVGSVDLDLEHELRGARKIGAGYFLERRGFDQHPAYDLDLHYGYAELTQGFGPLSVSARLDGSVAYLGGERLLENHQFGLELSRLLNRSWYLRGKAAFKQTDILRAPERNNDDARLLVAGYYFLDGTAHYLSASYRVNAKRAVQSRFDYDAHRFGLLYNRRLSDWAILKLDWRYEERLYLSSASTPASGQRLDERQRWRARLEVPIGERIELELRYEHRDNASNLASVDYTDNRLEARVTLQLL